MGLRRIWEGSLKTRVSVVALLVFLMTIWSLTWYAGEVLRQDMQKVLGEEQRSTVDLVASHINDEISARLRALEAVAADLGPAEMASPDRLQRVLSSQRVFSQLFSGGAFITGADGVARASLPAGTSRIGRNYSDRDYFKTAVRDGRVAVGRPIMARVLRVPVFVFSAPIRDRHEKVIGMIAAAVDLSKPSFLDRISEQPFAKSGNYFVVSRTYRQIVISSDKDRTLDMIPPPGVNPTVDRFVDGFEGATTFVNSQGVEVLAAVKGIPAANWFAAVSIPTAVVYAPIRSVQYRIGAMAVVLTVVAGALMWRLLRRELAPLQASARALSATHGTSDLPRLAPGPHPDEIGQVISGFNRVLADLAAHRESLAESERRYRAAWQTSPDAMALSRLSDGLYFDVNEGYARLTGWSREEMIGRTALDLGIWVNLVDRVRFSQAVSTTGRVAGEEYLLRAKSGRLTRVRISARQLDLQGEACVLKVIHDLSDRDAAREQIQQLERTDALTGLPNRGDLIERTGQAIAAAVRHGRLCALMDVDLDDFKTLNDTLGHDEGDALLKRAGERLRRCVRVEDTVARIGGDEFAVLLEGLDADAVKAAAQAEAIARSIHETMASPFPVRGVDYRLHCSIGVTLIGQSAEPSVEPLKRADLAMYQAKAAGRSCTRFFEPQMQTILNARTAMQSDLLRAIEGGQLQLHYQVQVDCRGAPQGVEALVRWPDSSRGMVSPAEFIPLAESTGIIVPLGQWVLKTACAQLAAWAADPVLARLSVAINVSPRQFERDDFVDQVVQALARTGAPAGRLKLEITESSLAHDFADVRLKMNALKGRGVGFSLDDFGTGFSSLSYLKELPLDQLKIDQSFVRDILVDANDLAIAKTVVALGNTLGLNVIAEGVETAGQRDALAEIGCHAYQGYLFGRPAVAQEVERALREAGAG